MRWFISRISENEKEINRLKHDNSLLQTQINKLQGQINDLTSITTDRLTEANKQTMNVSFRVEKLKDSLVRCKVSTRLSEEIKKEREATKE